MDGPLHDDEKTTVLRAGSGARDQDERTTVLGGLKVSLVREKTGEPLDLALPCTVGKGTAAGCRIAGNPAISRVHARLYTAPDPAAQTSFLYVEDLGSLNGTSAEGQTLARGAPRRIGDGSRLVLADESFVVRVRLP